MSEKIIEVDIETFSKHLEIFYDNWKSSKDSVWNGADAIVVNAGEESEQIYSKTIAISTWLFGLLYELTDTVLVFCEKDLYILSSPLKISFFKSLKQKENDIKFHLLSLEEGNHQDRFQELIEAIKQSHSGNNIGIIKKETPTGDFIESWLDALKEANLNEVDVTDAIAKVFAVKDAKEIKNIKTSAAISTFILKNHLVPLLETVIDEEQEVTHQKIAEKTEKLFEDPSKVSKKLTSHVVDSCYAPMIQSGGEYNLRPGAENNDQNLHFGTIVCSLGARFKSYCSNVARTYFVDPKKEQEETYNLLLKVQQLILKKLKPGVVLKEILQTAQKFIADKNPELEKKFTKTCGFGMGVEFQEAQYTLNSKNERKIEAGMVFNIAIGFKNVELKAETEDERAKIYSTFLADTVLVKEDGIEVLTEKCPKAYSDISYFLGEEEEEEEEKVKKEKSKAKEKPQFSTINPDVILERKFRHSTEQRAAEKEMSREAEDKRREHQKALEERKRLEAAERFSSKSKPKKENRVEVHVADSYKSPEYFPREALKKKIFIDPQRESILLPIYGQLVPFHVSNIKNVSKTDDEYLRINFVTPESTQLANIGKPKIEPQNPDSIHIKEICYHCVDPHHANNASRAIKELRRKVTAKQTEMRESASLVVQEKLKIAKGRVPKLNDVFVRPYTGGKRTTGTLEAQINGFRFSTLKGAHIDILYANIKHAFLQEARNDYCVILHFHLHNGIMVGKKKSIDVQFCAEVIEISTALDGRRYEADGIEEEQRERLMKAKLNQEFKNFAAKVEDIATDLEFDSPYPDLAFYGVPNRSNVLLQPTVHCLVNLSEPPFFVITLSDVEIAYFERVQFNLRNFDLVFVFKDYSKPVSHINSIPTEHLETIKEWLDSCDIKYYEGPQNLNWKTIMARIAEDPKRFHTEDGGWKFLNLEDSEEDEEEEEAESDFQPSEASAEEYESKEEDDYSEDAYSEESEEEEGSEEESEESEGEDWDKLEEKARREDERSKKKRAQRSLDFSSDEEEKEKEKPPKRRKR